MLKGYKNIMLRRMFETERWITRGVKEIMEEASQSVLFYGD
jgi:hypothetical protein